MIVKCGQTWNALKMEYTGSGEFSGYCFSPCCRSSWKDVALAFLSSEVCCDIGRLLHDPLTEELSLPDVSPTALLLCVPLAVG